MIHRYQSIKSFHRYSIRLESFDLYFIFIKFCIWVNLFKFSLGNLVFLHDLSNSIKHFSEFNFKFNHRKKHSHCSVNFYD